MADYEKAGLLVIRDGKILLCRKHGLSSKLILPGGKFEEGETARQCLAREIREELSGVILGDVHYVGTYEDRAASDDPTVNKTVSIELYSGDLVGEPTPSSEISEVVWFKASSKRDDLSPILENKIVPDLVGRGILPWDW